MIRKNKQISLKKVLAEELKDSEFSFYFEQAKTIGKIAKWIRNARIKAGLTQSELAKRAKTSQTVIARLESGSDFRMPSLNLLDRIARAFKAKLTLRFESRRAA